jgi:hypothetical protein
MSFLVSLAHFVGWVVTIPALIYLFVSFVITLYAFVFWYTGFSIPLNRKLRFTYYCGFKYFWDWLFGFVEYLIFKAYDPEYWKYKQKYPPFSKEWC